MDRIDGLCPLLALNGRRVVLVLSSHWPNRNSAIAFLEKIRSAPLPAMVSRSSAERTSGATQQPPSASPNDAVAHGVRHLLPGGRLHPIGDKRPRCLNVVSLRRQSDVLFCKRSDL